MFDKILFAFNPILLEIDYFKENLEDFCFIYGDHDWMDLDFIGPHIS